MSEEASKWPKELICSLKLQKSTKVIKLIFTISAGNTTNKSALFAALSFMIYCY